MKNSIIKFRHSLIALIMIVLNGVGALASIPWTVNPSDYRYDMSLYLDVTFAGVKMDYSQYEAAAFYGDECRGIAEVLPLGNGKECLYLRARSNQESGEMMTFKYYNKGTEEIQSIDGVSFAFESNGRLGYPSDPYIVNITHYYDVLLTSSGGGSVDPQGGSIAEGTELIVTATPNEGHHFEKWSDGSIENPRTIVVNDNIALTAEFGINTYKLIYTIDGEPYKEYELDYGTVISPEPIPEKEGYTFSGWEGLPETMPARDVTVTGSFAVNSYKLTYMVDGETYKEMIVEYGTKLTAEAAPTKEGYTFSGWEGLPETMPSHDVTVTGSFIINGYKLTYIIDGEIYKELTVEVGKKLTAEAAPTKEGYTFSGWEGLPETMPAHDVTVSGSFTVNSYKLTYVVDGETYKELTVEYGTKLTGEAAPTKEGYTFSGWEGLPETMPAHDVTVTGSFTVNSYKLTYVIDGETYKEQTVEYGTKLTVEAAPTKEGHTFSGWEGLPETMPAHDVIVTGSFTVNSYKLTYVVDGETYKELTVEYGTKLTAEAFPTKEGYTFSGWEGLPETMPAHDVTVTGSFTVNSYKLTYVVDGETYKEQTVEYGTKLTAEAAPTKEGYTFSGWEGLPETMPAHDVTVTGSFTVNSYKLTYVVDGTTYKELTVEYGTKLTAEAAPTKEGYTFSGWEGLPETMPAHDVTVTGSFTVNSYKLTYVVDGETYKELTVEYGTKLTAEAFPTKEGYTFSGWEGLPETMPAHDVTVTGSFTVNSYKLTYVVDGETYKEQTVEYGTKLTVEAAPTKEGYTFSGWEGLPETMPAHDVTVTGRFTVNSYKLTYVVDGETYKEQTVEYGTKLTAEAAPVKEGYTFSGWEGLPETMPAHDVTVSGSFTVNSYKLTYVVDGTTYKELTVEYGTKLTAEAAPTKEGYTFSGWEGLPEIMPAHDVTVTGSFTVNSYKLTYVVDGETYKEMTVEYGTKLTAEAAPTKEGYTFSGWEGLPETMPAHDVTVTGSFTVNSYKLTYVIDGETYKELTVEYGTKLTAEAAPTKEGYTFSGWEGLPETMPAHDVTVTGSFTVNSYKLTYVVDGAIFKELTVEYGTKLTVEAAPTKEGYTFSGWEGLPETMSAHDVTVTGSFTVNSYKLTYVVDGETYKELTVEYGMKLTAEAAPTKEGYTFSGWEGLPETMPAHDVTVTGSFTVNSYKLTYVVDGTTYKELTVEYGTKLTAEAAPTKEGYTFSGWEGLPETMPAHDVTVTGSFTVNSYKLTYVVDGETYKELAVEYGTKLTAESAPTKEGYTFSGWEGFPETMPAHDVTVTGSFTVNSYKLTYVVDGETYKELTVEYGAKLTAEAAPTKEGYTFGGWEGLPETMPARDVTVTAVYDVNYYWLRTYVNDNLVYEEEIAYGAKVIVPDPEIGEGYTFNGWAEEVPDVMPAHDVELHALVSVGIDSINSDGADETVDVYSIAGQLILHNVQKSQLRNRLAPGLYIISGRKTLIK